LWQEIGKGNATKNTERDDGRLSGAHKARARDLRALRAVARATTFRRVYFLWIKSAPFDDAKKNFFQRDYYESLAYRCGRIL